MKDQELEEIPNLKPNLKKGFRLNAKITRAAKENPAEYKAWANMRQRCYNPNNTGYKNYGGRGIQVCYAWRYSFAIFLRDMGKRPSDKHSIDRIDNNGDYTPNNCRWALRRTQSLNRNHTGIRSESGRYEARITFNDKSYSLGTFDKERTAAQVHDRVRKLLIDVTLAMVTKEEAKSWRDNAVRENLLYFAIRVGETSYEVDEYLKEQYQQELQDGK